MNRASLFLIWPVLFWGFSYIAIKIVLEELEPVEMISMRFLLAAPTLYIILKLKGLRLWPVDGFSKLIVAAFLIFIHFWVMAVGMKETTASNTSWILATAPIFIAVLSWLWLKEPFTGKQWLGLLVACAGVLFLMYNGDISNVEWINSRGDVIVLGSCVTWAIYTVGARDLTKKINALVATFWSCVIAGLVFIPYTLATSGVSRFTNLQTDTYIALVFLGVFCLALAFWLWSEGLARQTAAEVGVYLYFEPLLTVIGAWFLLGEEITNWLAVGAVLITAGVYVAEKYGKTTTAAHNV
ncbi:MAG: DMT family transporter [Candidatus Zixiibacteriota bacterium]